MLEGKNIILRPLEAEDLIQMKEWRNSEQLRPNTREFRPLNDVNQLEWFESLVGSNDIMFAIDGINKSTTRTEGDYNFYRLIGCCGLTYIDWKNGNAEISLYIGRKSKKEKLQAVEAMNILLKYGFKELRLHRLYVVVFEYNDKNLELVKECKFKSEGKHIDARYFDGTYHNEMLFYMLEDDFKWKK